MKKEQQIKKTISILEHDMKIGLNAITKIPKIIKSKKGKLQKHEEIEKLIESSKKKLKIKNQKYEPILKKLKKDIKTSQNSKKYQIKLKKLLEYY